MDGLLYRQKAIKSIYAKWLPTKDGFKLLGSMLRKEGEVEEDVSYCIKAGLLKWRATIVVLCEKKVPLKLKLKGKFVG